MTQTMNEKEMHDVMYEVSCFKCCHFPVCIYFREIQQIVAMPEGAEEFQPFKAEDTAKICKNFSLGCLSP